MIWDPVDQTAIAQAEIEDKEMPSKMTDIRFSCAETGEDVVIATTRPELIGACVAVFYHPDDERYKHLKGKHAVTALFGVKVPILADEYVQMEKGTGLVMCCTFGDETDIKWWRTHNLPSRLLLDKYGKIRFTADATTLNFLAGDEKAVLNASNTVDFAKALEIFKAIEGKKTSNPDPKNPGAREITLALLNDAAVIVGQKDIVHAVKCAERSGAALEILPTYQWFVKILDQKEELKGKAAQCTWYPEYMKVRMDQWIDGLSWDWCISRQRYFGVPFPVWYSKRAGEEGKIIIAEADQLPVNPLVDLPKGYSRDEVVAEADVMDTWATSSVSPQLSSKGINDKYAVDLERHKKLFPADLRPQAHEIIRTWAFYTIVKAHLHEDTIPWKNLMISGWCLAADKSKMSKSKGNVVTPVDLVETKGSDVVRFWASTSRLGADTAYSEDVLKIGQKLVTKLWNATKFAAIHLNKLQNVPGVAKADVASGVINEPLDLWILTRLNKAIKKATQEFEKYEYCNARAAAEDFFWNDFCDNYLELVKVRVYGEVEGSSKAGQMSAVHTIYHCLDGILRLFAPIVPHVTEELYSHIFDDKIEKIGGSVHARGSWLKSEDYPVDEAAEESGIACVAVLNAVRKLKAERNVSIKWPLNVIVVSGENVEKIIGKLAEDLKNVTSSARIVLGNANLDKAVSGKTEDGRLEFADESSNAA